MLQEKSHANSLFAGGYLSLKAVRVAIAYSDLIINSETSNIFLQIRTLKKAV